MAIALVIIMIIAGISFYAFMDCMDDAERDNRKTWTENWKKKNRHGYGYKQKPFTFADRKKK